MFCCLGGFGNLFSFQFLLFAVLMHLFIDLTRAPLLHLQIGSTSPFSYLGRAHHGMAALGSPVLLPLLLTRSTLTKRSSLD